MGIRSWFGRQSREADADAIEQAEEDAIDSPEERGQGDRWDQGADNRVAGRLGERPDDLGRLGDFNP
jgi:hypothetical protein